MLKKISLTLVATLLVGCAAGPDYRRPAEDVPTHWPEGGMQSSMDAQAEWARWWTRYRDPILDQLVADALANNLDVNIAVARIAESRAMLGFREAGRYPTLAAQLDVNRGLTNPNLPGSGSEARTSYGIAGVLDYEVDLWGRLARSTEAARAELLQVTFAAEAVRLGLITDLVTGYFDLRMLQQQIHTTRATILARQQALALQQSRFRNGAIPELTLRQSEAELAHAQAQLPLLEGQASQRARALAVMIGLPATQVMEPLALRSTDLSSIHFSTVLAHRLPSELLERRPDIRASEAGLMAANAEIGVARSSWFPRVNLAAMTGSTALASGSLFSSPAGVWQVGASVLAPVLDFGRRRSEIATTVARRDIAELQYRATIRNAFREVGDAWALLESSNQRLEALNRQVAALNSGVELAERRYDNGYSPFLELLDARRALYDAQLAQSDAMRDRLIATAVLFKVLGGGWEG
jgi:multidrug efflux system outer membrane protein